MAKNVPAQDIQNLLSGMQFPATKQGIISYAKDKKAPGEVIDALNGIPDKEYMDMDELMKEVGSRLM